MRARRPNWRSSAAASVVPIQACELCTAPPSWLLPSVSTLLRHAHSSHACSQGMSGTKPAPPNSFSRMPCRGARPAWSAGGLRARSAAPKAPGTPAPGSPAAERCNLSAHAADAGLRAQAGAAQGACCGADAARRRHRCTEGWRAAPRPARRAPPSSPSRARDAGRAAPRAARGWRRSS